ncbi:MAG: PilW family protein, partial [Gammaproteobacteria bacterium]
PTNAEKEQVTEVVREKLKEQGTLKGEARVFDRLLNLSFTESEKKDPSNYQEGQYIRFIRNTKGGFKAGGHYEVVSKEENTQEDVGIVVKDLQTGQELSLPYSTPKQYTVFEKSNIELNQGDLVLVSNCLYGDVFAISNEPADTGPIALKHQTPYNQNSKLFYPYTKNAKVRRFIAETFFVADSGRTAVDGNAIYSLYRAYPSTSPTANDLTYEELVEGVEFMKILYGQRVSKNNIHYVSAPDNAKANSAFWLSVESIQLALLLRATTPTLSADNTTVYRLLGENIGPGETLHYQADRSYRQVFKTTVYLRNRS